MTRASTEVRPGRKSVLLATTGAIAIALALPAIVHAQAIQATPDIFQGTVIIDSMVPDQDTIIVTGFDAVIDWTPTEDVNGDALTFLPSTGTVVFQSDSSGNPFAVINRILPATNLNATQIDGAVISQLVSGSGLPTPGGHVLFYSPTGLIIGNTASFDVGSLVLTTLDPDLDSYQDFVAGTGPLSLIGQPNDLSVIDVRVGATIDAPAEGSYLVFAAPETFFGGASRVNGSTVFAAGQEMTLAHASGLFDIVIPFGSASATPITHVGSSGGPASSAAGDNHVIYGVAQGQFDPFATVFGGNLGFDPAVSATVENGVVILTANYRVNGTQVLNDFTSGSQTGFADASLVIDSADLTSDLVAHSSASVEVASSDNPATFAGDLFIYGRESAQISASSSGAVTVAGNATVIASVIGQTIPNPNSPILIDGTGGLAAITVVDNGSVTIDGDTLVLADGTMGLDPAGLVAGNAFGGEATISANNGTVTLNGDVTVSASGLPAPVFAGIDSGGSATGGIASLVADAGGTVTIGGSSTVSATGDAFGLSGPGNGNPPGDGTGGQVFLTANDTGTLDLGPIVLDASGSASFSSAATGGTGTGGSVSAAANLGGVVLIDGDFEAYADAEGGQSIGGTGGLANGGNVSLTLNEGGTFTVTNGGITLGSTATGAQGGVGGAAVAGTVTLELDDSQLSAQTLDLIADATGGVGTATVGGTATGGTVEFSLQNASLITLAGDFTASATGTGGTGQEATGALGTGGLVDLVLSGSTLDAGIGDITLRGGGTGGSGYVGGQAAAGEVSLAIDNTGSVLAGDLLLDAGATGGGGSDGDGGSALAGTAALGLASGGRLTATGTVTLGASAIGGSGDPGVAGDADGGTVQLVVEDIDSQLSAAGIVALADGSTSTGGTATAGLFQIDAIDSGLIQADTLTASAQDLFAGSQTASASRLQALTGGQIAIATFADLTTAGDITLAASQGGQIYGGTDPANLTATFQVRSLGLLQVTGDDPLLAAVSADTLFLDSYDIDIGAGATVVAGNFLALSAIDPDNTAVVGGGAQGPGYTLTNDEIARLRATALSVSSQTQTEPVALELRDITLVGTLNPQGFGSVSFFADGLVRVVGQVNYSSVASTDEMFVGGGALEIVLPTGGIRLVDAGSTDPGLAGTLTLNGRYIYAADANLLDILVSNPDAANLADLLRGNGTNAQDGSFIFADRVELAAGDHILTQNTGVGSDFSGIVVGPGGLSIRREGDFGPGIMRVITFGAQDNGGTFVRNDAFFALVDFSTPTPADDYTSDATLNDCNIVTGQCGNGGPSRGEPDLPIDHSDYVDLPDLGTDSDTLGRAAKEEGFGFDFPRLLDPPPVGDQGLVTDPVTSGGDSAALGDGDEDEED